jgi:hypothetical protein
VKLVESRRSGRCSSDGEGGRVLLELLLLLLQFYLFFHMVHGACRCEIVCLVLASICTCGLIALDTQGTLECGHACYVQSSMS